MSDRYGRSEHRTFKSEIKPIIVATRAVRAEHRTICSVNWPQTGDDNI